MGGIDFKFISVREIRLKMFEVIFWLNKSSAPEWGIYQSLWLAAKMTQMHIFIEFRNPN